MRCHRFICTRYKDGSLLVQEQQATPYTTKNEIMVQIFVECEKFSFDILNDGIYQNDIKLGEVGHTDDGWWFTHAADETQQRILRDSAFDVVWWLSYSEPSHEYLQYRPLEQLSSGELQQLLDVEVADCEQLLDLPFSNKCSSLP
jgi:hypothetical protein